MKKPLLIFFLIYGFLLAGFVGSGYLSFNAADRLFDTGSYEEEIRYNGIEAEAKILSIDDALLFGGISINEMEYLEIKMEIDNGADEPYIVAIDTTVPKNIIIKEGDILPVKVDLENERRVVYDFERGDLNLENKK